MRGALAMGEARTQAMSLDRERIKGVEMYLIIVYGENNSL